MPAAVTLGIVIPLHVATAALLPSLILLSPASHGSGVRWDACLPSVAAGSIAYVILSLLGFNFVDLVSSDGASMLPIVAAGTSQPYGLISLDHLTNWLSEFLLVCPAVLVVLLVVGWRTSDRHGTFFLSVATLPLLAFTFLASPEIGAFRDWDVLSLPAVPATIWALLSFTRAFEGRSAYARASWQTWGACAIHTMFWVGLNADADAAETRFERNLARASLGVHATTYGWETLAAHYRLSDRMEPAFHAYQRAIEACPEKARLWTCLGSTALDLGNAELALRAYAKGTELEPHSETYYNIGLACEALGRKDDAMKAYVSV